MLYPVSMLGPPNRGRLPGAASRSEAWPFFLYAAFLAFLLHSSWLRWPDAGVDFGYFLYNSWSVSEGARIGADLNYYYGPLALLFYSGYIKALGPGILGVYAINLVFLCADIALIHLFFRRFSLATACLSTLCFLGVFALGQYIHQGNYNFLAPYKPEIPLGTPLLLLQAVLSARWLEARGPLRAALLGALCGCLLLTSTELALASLAGLAVLLLSARLGRREAACLALSAACPAVLSFGYFLTCLPLQPALRATFQALLVITHRSLVLDPALQEMMGADRPLFRLGLVLLAGAMLVLSGALCVFLLRHARGRARAATWALIAVSLPLLLWETGWGVPFWLFFPKALPFFPLLGILFWAFERGKNLALGVWSAMAALLLLRMLGNAMLHYYGFSLAACATLLIFPLCLEAIPDFFRARGMDACGLRPLAWAIGLALIGLALSIRQPFLEHKNFVVASGKDTLLDWDPDFTPRGPATRELLADLRARLRPGDLLLGLPDGHMVNYLLRAPRPRPFSLSLGELREFGEEAILSSYKAARPRFIFVAERESYDEQGGFGLTYGKSLLRWVQKDYIAVKGYGSPRRFTLYEAPGK